VQDLIIAVAQPDVAPRSHDEALALLAREIERAGSADLLVLPELFLCGYSDPAQVSRLATPVDSTFIAAVRDLARHARTGLILGHAERDGDTLFNVALAIGADGTLRSTYRKTHLWGGYEKGLFAPGSPSPVLAWGPLNLGLLICYDLEFPEAARALALRGADTLVVISATSFPYHVVPDRLVPARAYENGCFAVFANWAGVHDSFTFIGRSCIAGPDGAVMADGRQDASTIRATLSAERLHRWRADHSYLADRRPHLYGAEHG
jgi:5-aminopentanamidase